ncbi:dnaJ homolog subfamily C member 7-like, partial [Hibiscus syriacus]|uniref:dnaJ homolog subfamily C member 7-like n=1 Tax=Hibiscus syriacus TaxID=106335 RepID=UPI00192092DF
CNVESRPFAAICFCNCATAYKGLGQVTDAIADCNLAIALDGNYLKALSRRATLYVKIRDYGKANSDLERLLSLLMKKMEMTNQTGLSERSVNLANDTRHARSWLSEIEEQSKKEVPLDFYLILGIEPSASPAEIKKAYRKAALRHHPDKAVQSLVRTENGDDKIWKDIREEAYKDVDKLFKIIGEAYAVLSDSTKRSRYDSEEETRNL